MTPTKIMNILYPTTPIVGLRPLQPRYEGTHMPSNVQPPVDYIAHIEAWRQDMDAQMRAPGPGGWLAIVGMYPLEEGENTVGSAPDSDVLLPTATPDRLGIVDFHDQ